MSVPVIRVCDVSKKFVIHKDKSLKERLVNFKRSQANKVAFWALRNVDLEIASGESIGLIGANGSGKSTLLKTIGGILTPNEGYIERRGRLAALLELGAGFHPDLTGRENVYLNASVLGMSRAQTSEYFDRIVDFSGIEEFIDTQVKFYSSGMYVRLAFAVAVHVDPDILLVDEVLAVGDELFQRKCMDRIKAFQKEGRTIVFVTHSLDLVGQLCKRAVVLESGHLTFDGRPEGAIKLLRADFEEARLEEIGEAQAAAAGPVAAPAPLRIGAITAVPGGNRVELSPGQDLTLDVTVIADRPVPSGWVLGLGIDSPLGGVVWGTNTEMMGLELPPIEGTRTFQVRLPDLRLGQGDYSMHAAVVGPDGVECHRLAQAISLSVDYGATRGVGTLDVSAEFVAL